MYPTSRRNVLQSMFYLPMTWAGARFLPRDGTPSQATTGYLNVHLLGPFTYLFYANSNRKEVLIVSPDPLNHHLPCMLSQDSEAPIQKDDYALVGVNATSKARPDWPNLRVSRIAIDAHKLGMDQGGVIDPGKAQRFFSLKVPSPDWIVPWHSVQITVTGNDSPHSSAVLLPVGYTFVYENQSFSQIAVNSLATPSNNWKPQLAPFPGQNTVDILIEMSSTLDIDCKHKGAIEAFADECNLYTGVNIGAQLRLGLDYGQPTAGCLALEKALKDRKRRAALPLISDKAFGHTGTDCKAALLEITNVADNVTLG